MRYFWLTPGWSRSCIADPNSAPMTSRGVSACRNWNENQKNNELKCKLHVDIPILCCCFFLLVTSNNSMDFVAHFSKRWRHCTAWPRLAWSITTYCMQTEPLTHTELLREWELSLSWAFVHNQTSTMFDNLFTETKYCQLRARRALLQIKDVPLRTRRALLPLTLYSNSALLVLSGTSLSCNNALLALNWRYAFFTFTCQAL